MQLIIDAHVHFYPCYNPVTGLNHLFQNLWRHAHSAVRIALLAESSNCHFFSELESSAKILKGSGFSLDDFDENIIHITKEGQGSLLLMPGRQIITKERLEVLSLTKNVPVADFLPAEDVIRKVLAIGGIPVLSWAPGKWLFKRSKVVRQLLEMFSPKELLIGDTSLRPTLWREPLLMRRAQKLGLNVLAGSDPLPFSGEERFMGTYASLVDGDFNMAQPTSSLRELLLSPETKFSCTGNRNATLEALCRLKRNRNVRRSR